MTGNRHTDTYASYRAREKARKKKMYKKRSSFDDIEPPEEDPETILERMLRQAMPDSRMPVVQDFQVVSKDNRPLMEAYQ
jgi:hypothetical protein